MKKTTMKKKIMKPTTPTVEKKVSTVSSSIVKPEAKKEEKKVIAEPQETTKKISAKPEAKKIASAKAPEKITAKPAAKKIATAKAPEKIAAKPAAKKIVTAKAPEKISAKPEPKKIVTAKQEKLENTEVKTAKKAVVKEEKKKATTTKAKKVSASKPEAKKATKFKAYSLEECIAKMQAMGVLHTFEDYASILLDESDLKVIEKNIIDGNQLLDKTFDFEKDGFDVELVGVTLEKVADVVDVKAQDFATIKSEMKASMKTKVSKDDEKNAKEYLKEFKICEKLLMIGQRKHVVDSKEISTLIGADVHDFVKHFFAFATEILPTWQYDDVKFYEDFAYAILSQYTDLYEEFQLELLIDCADLYIKHGDFLHGDECYGYILRDNQIKDYIYYRFAAVYKDIDINKAKSIAYEALQYVDERFTYYKNIMEIING
ncbi:MAG: neurofilament protein [Longicatena sp.]